MSLKLKSGDTFVQVSSLQSNFLASSEPQLETLKNALFPSGSSHMQPFIC